MSIQWLRKECQALEMAPNQAKSKMFNKVYAFLRMLCLQFSSLDDHLFSKQKSLSKGSLYVEKNES